MAKAPVLGNDPFQRGAADRTPAESEAAPAPRSPPARKPRAAAAKPARSGARKPAARKPAAAARPETEPAAAPARPEAPTSPAKPKRARTAPAAKTAPQRKKAVAKRPAPAAEEAAPARKRPPRARKSAPPPTVAAPEPPQPAAEPQWVAARQPAAEPAAAATAPEAPPEAAAVASEEVVVGELVDEIPSRRPRLLTEGAAREEKVHEGKVHEEEPREEEAHLRRAPSGLFGQLGAIAQVALANPWVHRVVESVVSHPLVEKALGAATFAAHRAAPAYEFAAKVLPPAASMAKSAVSAVVTGHAARDLVIVAAEAGETARKIATRVEPKTFDVDSFGEDPSLTSRLEPLFDFMHDRYFRVDVQGAPNVPPGACILVCNHSGALPIDGPMIRTVLRRECGRHDARWLIEDALFHAPFMGVALNRLGAVRACPENAERLLAQGNALAVFPEGLLGISKPIGRRYQLQRFGRGGFVKLAMRTGVPIVPVAIVGAEEASPLLARIPAQSLGVPYVPVTPTFPLFGLLGLVPLPTKWAVSFLPPVDLTAHGPQGALDHALVSRYTADIRDSMQHELDRLLAERRARRAG